MGKNKQAEVFMESVHFIIYVLFSECKVKSYTNIC